jgi:2,4-dienoyl-CoA reductase-like NADH-dependent reductase (Old Yellow Enzyme family)
MASARAGPQKSAIVKEKPRQHDWPFRAMAPVNGPVIVASVENRYRFLKEVVEAVTSVWPAHRVGKQLSPNSPFNGMGSRDYREQFTFVAGQLDPVGLAYLHVVDGLAFGLHNLGEPMTLDEFRKVFHGPLMGICGYTRETAAKAIAARDADLISFGRPFISNPDLVEPFRND